MVTAKPIKLLIISRTLEAQLGFQIMSIFFSLENHQGSLAHSRCVIPFWVENTAVKVSNLSATNSHFETDLMRVRVTSMF